MTQFTEVLIMKVGCFDVVYIQPVKKSQKKLDRPYTIRGNGGYSHQTTRNFALRQAAFCILMSL